jgi:hypothetical protein
MQKGAQWKFYKFSMKIIFMIITLNDLIFLGAGIFMLFIAFSTFAAKLRIQNTPTSKIRSIAMGPVEIYGEVVPLEGSLLKSPITNHDCVYWKCVLERREKNGWRAVAQKDGSTLFMLRDETGSVLVDPKGAKTELSEKYVHYSTFGIPEQFEHIFQQSAFITLMSIGRTRISEFYIAPGEKLYIYGRAGDNPYKAEGTSLTNVEDIMIQKGSKFDFFYISDKPEKLILIEYTVRFLFFLLTGFVLIILALSRILSS